MTDEMKVSIHKIWGPHEIRKTAKIPIWIGSLKIIQALNSTFYLILEGQCDVSLKTFIFTIKIKIRGMQKRKVNIFFVISKHENNQNLGITNIHIKIWFSFHD